MKWKMLSVLAAVMAMSSQVSAASVTGFLTEASYNAFVGGDTFFLNFDGLVQPGSTGVFAGVDFNTIGATNPDLVNLNTYVGDAGDPTTPNNVGRLQGVLDAPAFAIGMNILSAEGSGQIEVYDASNAFLASVGYTGNGFVGLLTDMEFTSFAVIPFSTPAIGNDRIFIDDFRITSAVPPVPLPASGLLLGAAIGWLRLRKKNAS